MASRKEIMGLFAPAKNKRLARIISIETPAKFRKSIEILSKDGLTVQEFKALTLAKTRAKVSLKRKNLSAKERREFTIISNMNIPSRSSPKMKRKPMKGSLSLTWLN